MQFNALQGGFMTLNDIKQAVQAGKSVHWANDGYQVIKGEADYFVRFNSNDYLTPLERNGALIDKEVDFYIKGE
jgi:hypothetical protein